MLQPVDKAEAFEDLRKVVVEEMIKLKDFIMLYDHLYEIRQREPGVFDFAPGFFLTLSQSFFSSAIIWTCKLIIDKNSYGVLTYLEFVTNNKALFTKCKIDASALDNLILKDNTELSRIDPILRNIKRRRNKYHAHFDKPFLLNKARLNKQFNLDRNSLLDAVKVTENIINNYSNAYDRISHIFDPLNQLDVDRIIDLIRQENKRVEEGILLLRTKHNDSP
jgi:hypothetical protein